MQGNITLKILSDPNFWSDVTWKQWKFERSEWQGIRFLFHKGCVEWKWNSHNSDVWPPLAKQGTSRKWQVDDFTFSSYQHCRVFMVSNNQIKTFKLSMTCCCKNLQLLTFCLAECTDRVVVILIPAIVKSDQTLVPYDLFPVSLEQVTYLAMIWGAWMPGYSVSHGVYGSEMG